VAVIDEDGILTVTGTGTAVITATVGTVTDSVVIEGIENVASGSKNNLPVYTGTTVVQGGNTGSTQSAGGNTTGSETGNGGGSSENTGGTSSGNTGTGGNSGAESGGSSGEASGGNTQTSGNGGQTTGSLGDSTQTSGNGETSEGSTAGSTGGSGTASISTDQISSYGFTQRYSNVYVYETDQTYYGEIITQPNVTIIYIKQRNSDFDSKIQAVISEIIPDDNGQVWSNYLSAGTDRTFMVDNHKVRIVVAPNGGHSQIVIYN
jgi:hypothetical protein